MGGSSDIIQRAMGGLQIGTGIAATAMGQPMVGIPMMAGGISSEVKGPNPNEGPLTAGLGGAMNLAGGAAGLGGAPTMPGGGALGGSGDIGAMADITGTGAGAGMSQMPLSMIQGGNLAMAAPQTNPLAGLQGLNPQMLSGLLGGRTQQAQTQPPSPPPPIRPPLTLQNAPQQMAMPQQQPVPQIPQQPQNPQLQALLMRLMGGTQ